MAKDNSTGKNKEFYELGKRMFDRIQPLTTKGNNMNKQCKHIEADGFHHCGSYAFNLYKEDIDQGDLCDVHYWQDQAMKAAAQEREECAKVCIQMADRCDDIRKAALETAAENIMARGTT